MLIVIEGLDGSGKSTQVEKVRKYLADKYDRPVRYIHFPRYDAPVAGGMIARFLRGEFGTIDEVHPQIVALMFADDRRDAAPEMKKWLKNGDIVFLDRYVYSNIAFQCAKMNDPAEADKLAQWIKETEYIHYGIPVPDLNIFLDVPLAFVDCKLKDHREGDDREYLNGKQDIHEADISFQKKVRDIYLKQCASDSRFIRIDCSDNEGRMLPVDGIFTKIKSELDKI